MIHCLGDSGGNSSLFEGIQGAIVHCWGGEIQGAIVHCLGGFRGQ